MAAASCWVRNGLSARPFGRSNGVIVSLVQVPCRSGSPHAVRGALQSAAARLAAARTRSITERIAHTPSSGTFASVLDFHERDAVHATAGEREIAVARDRHVAHDAAARR